MLRSSNLLLPLLLLAHCASPRGSAPPAAASAPAYNELPGATLAKPQPPASLPASMPSFELQAAQPRFTGRLWTLCDPTAEDSGFCLSLAQAREVWLRFKEDQAHFKRLAIDAIKAQDEALARLEGEAAAHRRAVLGGVLGTLAAILVGFGVGVTVDHFWIRH